MNFRITSLRAAMPALAALVLLLSAGTAAGQDSTSTRNAESLLPKVVDVAGLTRALAALKVPDLPPGVYPVFELHFDSTGSFRSVTPAPHLPEAYAGPVMEAIRAHVKQPASLPSAGWLPVALVARAGPNPQVYHTLPFSVIEEQPELSNRSTIGRLLEPLARRLNAELGGEARFPYRTEMRVRITPEGTVDSVSVVNSSGDTHVDERIKPVVMQMRFRPARINGRPRRVWVTLPVIVGLPER